MQYSDEEEDRKRVVRSAKEKRYEQLHAIIKTIRNSKKIKDFYKMESSFIELTKALEKARPVIVKEENGVVPKFYIRILVEMEDLINETWEDKEGRKNMNKNNSKSLGSLRQKLRKYIREEFEEEVAKIRENPDAEDEPEEAEGEERGGDDDDDDDDGDLAKPVSEPSDKGKLKKAKVDDDDDDSEDSYWGEDSEESSESSSDDEPGMSLREKFLKKTTAEGDEKKKKDKKDKEKKKKERQRERSSDEDEDPNWIMVDRGALEKPKMFDKDAEINHDLVVKKLHEIMAARGKRRTNRKEQIELLNELLNISMENNLGPAIEVKIQFAIIAAIFDYNPKISSAMKPEYWEKCMPAIEKLLVLLDEHADDLTSGDNINDDAEVYDGKPYKVGALRSSSVLVIPDLSALGRFAGASFPPSSDWTRSSSRF